jgi:anaerobic selenocysteine-containing dehydrogenase
VRIASARGAIEAPARVGGVRDGVVFVPFHYGYWDVDGGAEPADEHDARAANELTLTAWDPVSKQPLFKVAAVSVTRVEPADARGADRGSRSTGAGA